LFKPCICIKKSNEYVQIINLEPNNLKLLYSRTHKIQILAPPLISSTTIIFSYSPNNVLVYAEFYGRIYYSCFRWARVYQKYFLNLYGVGIKFVYTVPSPTSLYSQGRGKVCAYTTLLRPRLCDYIEFIGVGFIINAWCIKYKLTAGQSSLISCWVNNLYTKVSVWNLGNIFAFVALIWMTDN